MKGNPFGGDVPPAVMARYLQNPGKLSSMLESDLPGMGASPAALLADTVNVHRADVRQMADALDVEDPRTGEPVSIDLMTEQRAADLLAGITDGDGIELLMIFNELARKRDLLLRELLDDDEHAEFMQQKTSVMFTEDPDTFEGDFGGN